jgi:hypothetical protein
MNIKVILITLGLIGMVYAWGQDGHKMVAQIAQNHLSRSTGSQIKKFLNGKYTRLEEIAPLADNYDHTDEGQWSRPCHYCNLPRTAKQWENQWCGACCVVSAISNSPSIIHSTPPSPCSFSPDDEPCALEFLVHFVGDIHQPLHVGYADDRGGNSVKVTWEGTATNLHAVWDEKIIQKWVSTFEEGTKELEQMLTDQPHLWDKYTQTMDPTDWANESFDHVKTDVYDFTGHSLGDEYYNQHLPIVKDRLLAAGVRLAQLLINSLP